MAGYMNGQQSREPVPTREEALIGLRQGRSMGGGRGGRIMEGKDQGERENGGVKTRRIQRLPQVLGAVFYLHSTPGVLPAVLSLKPFRQ